MNRLSVVVPSLLLAACSAAAPAVQPASVAPSAFPSPSPAGTTGGTPSPQATPATATIAPSPTAAPDVGLGFLPPGAAARVAVDALRLRAEPGIESPIVSTLAKDTLIEIAGPPFLVSAADGYQWRWVIVGSAATPEDWGAGWVATLNGRTFLSLEPVDCPANAVDLQTVISMTPWARLTCLGGQELVLEGTIVTGFGGMVAGTFEPGWLAHPFGFGGAISASGVNCCFFYHQQPGSEPTSGVDGDRLRLTGHFDDPAATTCRIATGEPPFPEPDELAVVYCRERFVATTVEIVGQ